MSKTTKDRWNTNENRNKTKLAIDVVRHFVLQHNEKSETEIIGDLLELAKEYKSRDGKPGHGGNLRSAMLYARKQTKGVKPELFAVLPPATKDEYGKEYFSDEIETLLSPQNTQDDEFMGAIDGLEDELS